MSSGVSAIFIKHGQRCLEVNIVDPVTKDLLLKDSAKSVIFLCVKSVLNAIAKQLVADHNITINRPLAIDGTPVRRKGKFKRTLVENGQQSTEFYFEPDILKVTINGKTDVQREDNVLVSLMKVLGDAISTELLSRTAVKADGLLKKDLTPASIILELENNARKLL